MISNENSERLFKNTIKYSRKLPEMFSTDDVSAIAENMTYGILGELRDRYNDNKPVVFSYNELAELGDLWIYRKDKNNEIKKELYNGNRLQNAMYELNDALINFSYYKVLELKDDGSPKSWVSTNIFNIIYFNGSEKKLTLTLNESEVLPEQKDVNGNVIQKALYVKDLLNSDDWSKVKHLQYNRKINNRLTSKYSKRLYRFLSEYRSFPVGTKMKIEIFDKKVLKIYRPKSETYGKQKPFDNRKNRAAFLKKAIKEISELKTEDGGQIVKNLDVIYHRVGNKNHSIELTFTPFKLDISSDLNKRRINKDNHHLIPAPEQIHTHSFPTPTLEHNDEENTKELSEIDIDAQNVIDYINYFWSITFNESLQGYLNHISLPESVIQFPHDKEILKLIKKRLKNGVPVETLMAVTEMKAIDWLYLNPTMMEFFKPSVIFGKNFPEYQAFIQAFLNKNDKYFVNDLNKDKDFYIPINGPWDAKWNNF